MLKDNVQIIGSTHLDEASKIVSQIESFYPDIIGVELCKTRFDLMIKPQSPSLIGAEIVAREGVGLIDKISNSIKKKAEEEQIQYGSDMITASKYALENMIPLALLDKDIMDIKRLMELLPDNEKIGFLTELANFESKTLGEQTKKIDENEVLEQLKTKYPVAFEFLINSRDVYIAYKILKVMSEHPDSRFICFLGRGHELSIKKLLGVL